MTESCKTCNYSRPNEQDDQGKTVHCRRYPATIVVIPTKVLVPDPNPKLMGDMIEQPIMQLKSVFIPMPVDEWCGEWKSEEK